MPVSTTYPTSDNETIADAICRRKRLLFVGAHPDDIEFYCAGLVQLASFYGSEICYAIATKGGRGKKGEALKKMKEARVSCQKEAADLLGASRVEFFDYPDGGLSDYKEEFAGDVRDLISSFSPDLVFSWDPVYTYNPHPDHVACAKAGLAGAGEELLCYYGTKKPSVWVGYDSPIYNNVIKSLKTHRTETPWYFFMFLRPVFTAKLRGEGRKIGAPYAEVFRLPRKL